MLISERQEPKEYLKLINEFPKKTIENLQESLEEAFDLTFGDFWKEIKEIKKNNPHSAQDGPM